jgi:hypothetical protein
LTILRISTAEGTASTLKGMGSGDAVIYYWCDSPTG